MIDIKFYDTNSFLLKYKDLFDKKEPFVISSITLDYVREYDDIYNIVYQHLGDSYFLIVIHKQEHEHLLNIPINHLSIDEQKILSDTVYFDQDVRPDETIFVTTSPTIYDAANLYFGDGSLEQI